MARVKKINVGGTNYDIAHEGALKNSGFEVVTSLPTTGLFEGREVMYQGKKYVYSSAWKEEITANTMYEDKLLYNKGTVLPGLSVVDNMMLPYRRANVYAFTNPEAISFDYSQDAGVTWLPYEVSDLDKQKFCTFGSTGIVCGGPDVTVGNVSYRLRVNLFPKVNGVSIFHKLFLSFIYGSAFNRWLTVRALRKNQDDVAANYVTLIDRGVIAGDIGTVAVNLGDVNLINVYSKVVIEIGYDGIGSGKGLSITGLSMFASCASPSNYLAKYNSMFFYDINKTSYFEGGVLSKEFINFDITNIEPTQTGSVTKTSGWLWQYLVQGVNWLKANKVALSVYNTKVAELEQADSANNAYIQSVKEELSNAIFPWYVSYNGVDYPARLQGNWLQIYRNEVWANLLYLASQEPIQPTEVTQITSFANLDWYNEQVSEYEIDSNTTFELLDGKVFIAVQLINCPANQLTLNLYPIPSGRYNKGALDWVISDLQKNNFAVFVENDLDTILTSGNDFCVRIKISKVPTYKAIVECYVAR